MSEQKQACPECGERTGVPIVWGLVTEDVFDDPGVAIGGCVVDLDPSTHRCRSCGHEWRIPV